jgi:hypothetical protein
MNTQKQVTIPKSFKLTENILEKMKELQNNMGLKSEVSVIEYCINFTYEKKFDNYVAIQKNRPQKTNMTPSELANNRADRYESEKKARQEVAIKNGKAILEELEGEEFESSTGVKMGRFKIYSKDTPINGSISIREMAIVDMFDELVETQYKGCTKEEWQEITKKENFNIEVYG